MNLANFGLALDSRGKIARPDTGPLDINATAPDYGVDIAEIFEEAISSVSGTSGLNIGPRLFSAAQSARRRSSRPRRRKREHPVAYRRRVKNKLGLVDIDQDIRDMNLKTLRRHFGYKNGKIQRGLFCRNVVWQVYRFTQAGQPPFFVKDGGNVRSLWYHVKPIVTRHSRSFGKKADYDGMLSDALTDMTNAGLLAYRDLNFIDQNKVNRWVSPRYGSTNIVIMAEKRSFSQKLLDIGKEYGVTVQCTGGFPSRVTVETMLLEMAEAGHDLTKPFIVFALVDADPAGWNIASTFVNHMLELGLKKVKGFRPHGRRRPVQPWIDVVDAKDLETKFVQECRHRLTVKKRARALADAWVRATGGLYGRGGKRWALSSDVFMSFIDDHIQKKLPKFLSDRHQDYKKIVTYESLDQQLKNYIAARVIADQ